MHFHRIGQGKTIGIPGKIREFFFAKAVQTLRVHVFDLHQNIPIVHIYGSNMQNVCSFGDSTICDSCPLL